MQQFMWVSAIFIAMVVIVGPTIGGGLLWQSLKIGRVSGLTLGQCWKIYLAACCYTALALMILGFLTREQTHPLFVRVLSAVLVFGIPVLVVPIFIRNYSRPALVVETIAVLLAQGIIFFVFLLALEGVAKPEETSADKNPLPKRGTLSRTVLPDAYETNRQPAGPGRSSPLARD